jgi:TIM-barrel protein
VTARFDPPVVAASLSGASDADWARAAAPYVGGAVLGGVAVDGPTREAASRLVARGREEFLPEDPVAFVDDQFEALADAPLWTGVNVRAVEDAPLRAVAETCARHGALLELNAHCRQEEMCDAGAGEALLADPVRLCAQVRLAADAGATVGVKVRTEVAGVDLPATCAAAADAGAGVVHVDAMDSEAVVADVVQAVPSSTTVVANNGVRGPENVREYLEHGADAVSVGRPSDDPAVLSRVRDAAVAWRAPA